VSHLKHFFASTAPGAGPAPAQTPRASERAPRLTPTLKKYVHPLFSHTTLSSFRLQHQVRDLPLPRLILPSSAPHQNSLKSSLLTYKTSSSLLLQRQVRDLLLPRLILPSSAPQHSVYAPRVAAALEALADVLHRFLALPHDVSSPLVLIYYICVYRYKYRYMCIYYI